MPFTIIRQDITKIEADAIVNAANVELRRGSGVCGAIFKVAGAADLEAACRPLSPIQTGEAVLTGGFGLPAKYIIHTAGPVYKNGGPREAELLGACYRNALELAWGHGCESIAFPLISSGIYGYPKDKALQIATETIEAFLQKQEMTIYLAVFDKKALMVSEQLLGAIDS